MEQRSRSDKTKFAVTLLSRIVAALVGIFFVPVYVKLIGIESYGLISFYSTLVGTLSLLDMGLSTAISRQVSIDRSANTSLKEIYDLVFSVEIIYWIIAVILGSLVILSSHYIALYWVNAQTLSVNDIRNAVLLMGIVFAFQFPVSIYNGVMIGFEMQISNAVIITLLSVIKAVGVIFVLMFVKATVEAYFIWQILVTVLFTAILRFYVWRAAFVNKIKAVFSLIQVKKIWRFAFGMAGISAIAFFTSQLDKIVVSKMLSLEYFGYYSLAFLISTAINQTISPMQPVIFPKLTALIASNDQRSIIDLYHKTARWISIIVFPIGSVLFFFGHEILLFWSNNDQLTNQTAPILRVCVVGSVCSCLIWVPYLFMIAKGNTRFTVCQNLIALVIMLPLLYILTKAYGAIGASFVWLIVNLGYVLISIPLFHRFFLKGELLTWFKRDIALPLITSLALIATIKTVQLQLDLKFTLIGLASMLLAATSIYMLVIPELRFALKVIVKNRV
jgi:O-antigen/teichoic acid export membrane protein